MSVSFVLYSSSNRIHFSTVVSIFLHIDFKINPCYNLFFQGGFTMSETNREKQLLKPGTIVVHFKRNFTSGTDPFEYLYEIIGVCLHSETMEELVVYKALYGTKKLYCRPKDMFLSLVDQEKYPDAKQTYRFEYYCNSFSQI